MHNSEDIICGNNRIQWGGTDGPGPSACVTACHWCTHCVLWGNHVRPQKHLTPDKNTISYHSGTKPDISNRQKGDAGVQQWEKVAGGEASGCSIQRRLSMMGWDSVVMLPSWGHLLFTSTPGDRSCHVLERHAAEVETS